MRTASLESLAAHVSLSLEIKLFEAKFHLSEFGGSYSRWPVLKNGLLTASQRE
jgi:hypothetical protein